MAGKRCTKCKRVHKPRLGKNCCTGHLSRNHPTDPGGPCTMNPMDGQAVCGKHGGKSPQAKAKAARELAEAKAEAEIVRRLGDSGSPITDPIGTLCSIAGRAVRFMELIGDVVGQLEDAKPDEDSRADIALYERSMSRAASIVESLIRMGIAERLAKVDEQYTAAVVAFIDGVLADLGHDPRSPEVAGVVAARLELVS